MGPVLYPSGSHAGSVAAGIPVRSEITFYPDSLGDYADYLRVETEGGSYRVPVIAQREPPLLDIPPTLDLGACMVGDAMRVGITCTNSGGRGRFRLLIPEHYPDVPADMDWATQGCIRVEPFTVYPVEFSLSRGQSIDLTIEFVPLTLGNHSRDFYMLCDNEQVRMFTLKASCRQIDITVSEVNGTPYDTQMVNLRQDMYFDKVVVTTDQSQSVVVANDTGLPVEYEWVWVDATLAGDDLLEEATRKIQESDRLRLSAATYIAGSDGMLLPGSAGAGVGVPIVEGEQLDGDPRALPVETATFSRGFSGVGGATDGAIAPTPLDAGAMTPRSPMKSMAGRLTTTGELVRNTSDVTNPTLMKVRIVGLGCLAQ
jgi:hypothetical protein